MYSHRLTSALGVSPEDGFVRASAVHYNTVEETDRLCGALDEVL
jgi:selenocysteine lyase/cysteine desulfurase